MWDALKRQRFQELRALPEPRSTAEQSELDSLVKELESAGSANLTDVTRKIGVEREQVEARNRRLESLVARRRGLAARLDNALADARAERQAIEAKLAPFLAAGSSARK